MKKRGFLQPKEMRYTSLGTDLHAYLGTVPLCNEFSMLEAITIKQQEMQRSFLLSQVLRRVSRR